MGFFSKGEKPSSSSESAPAGDWYGEQLGEDKGKPVRRNGEQDAASPSTPEEIQNMLE